MAIVGFYKVMGCMRHERGLVRGNSLILLLIAGIESRREETKAGSGKA